MKFEFVGGPRCGDQIELPKTYLNGMHICETELVQVKMKPEKGVKGVFRPTRFIYQVREDDKLLFQRAER